MRAFIQFAILAATLIGGLERATAQVNPCSEWKEGTTAYLPSPGRCDKFYQCSTNGTNEQNCPLGSLFSADTLRCDHSKNVLKLSSCGYCLNPSDKHQFADSCDVYYQCSNDEEGVAEVRPQCCSPGQIFKGNSCQTPQFGESCSARNYTHPKSCRSYFRCVDGLLTAFCCPEGERFERDRCVPDDLNAPWCTKPCVGNTSPRTDNCPNMFPVADNPCAYEVRFHGKTHRMNCPSGLGWDVTSCTCTANVLNLETCPQKACESYVYSAPLNNTRIPSWGFQDETRTYTGNSGVTGTGEYGVFKESAHLLLYVLQGNVRSPFMATITVQVDGTGEQVLLSNACPDSSNGTLTLRINPTTRLVAALVKNGGVDRTVVSANFPNTAQSDPWFQVSVKLAANEMSVNVKIVGDPNPSASVTETAAYDGGINSSCAMKIGQGTNTEMSFSGRAKKVQVYSKKGRCDTLPEVDFDAPDSVL